MSEASGMRFELHHAARGEDPLPPILRLDEPLSLQRLKALFEQHRREWFAPDLAAYADNIAQMLGSERDLSERWGGLPGAEHPAHWSAAAGVLQKAQPQPRVPKRLAVWHPPVAWVMPFVRRRGRQLRAHLVDQGVHWDAMAASALPDDWRRGDVTVRLDIETRVYWGARGSGDDDAPWSPCKHRGDGLGHAAELFHIHNGVLQRASGHGATPLLQRRLHGGVGLLVAVPVMSFERRPSWWQRLWSRWKAVARRAGWLMETDRDPTLVSRLESDEKFWAQALHCERLPARELHAALRDGAVLRPASLAAVAWQHRPSRQGGATAPWQSHVVLVHGGLSSARSGFEAMLDRQGAQPLWPGMPMLDAACTWRFEHDTFVPIAHNIARLMRWVDREIVQRDSGGHVVLLAHSRGGNVVRFALPQLRARFGPAWTFSAITAGAPHLGTDVFKRIGRRWSGLATVVGAVREMTEGWLDRSQLEQLVILERGLAYDVPPGFHDVEPDAVQRMAKGRADELPEGLWLWGSEWGPAHGHRRVEDALWDWLVEDIGGAEVGGDGLVARQSALCGRSKPDDGAHDASPVFHTQYFAHEATRQQMAERLKALLGP